MSDISKSLEITVKPRHYEAIAKRLDRDITPDELIGELNEFASICTVDAYRGEAHTGKRKLVYAETPTLAEASSHRESGGIFVVQRYGGNETTYRTVFVMFGTPEPSRVSEQAEIRWVYRDQTSTE